jgi:hypothetical protein
MEYTLHFPINAVTTLIFSYGMHIQNNKCTPTSISIVRHSVTNKLYLLIYDTLTLRVKNPILNWC